MALIRDAGTLHALVPAAARTASGVSALLEGMATADTLRVQLNVTAAVGTTPTLDVVLEDSLDGTNWNVIGTFAQRTAVGREVLNVTAPFTGTVRARWTVGGTTPSFTFAVDVYAQ